MGVSVRVWSGVLTTLNMKNSHPNPFLGLIWLVFVLCTANIGYYIHKSVIWAIVDFIFAPLVWIKWFVFRDVTLSIIKQSFEWFLQ